MYTFPFMAGLPAGLADCSYCLFFNFWILSSHSADKKDQNMQNNADEAAQRSSKPDNYDGWLICLVR
jgi:hypothetical protein